MSMRQHRSRGLLLGALGVLFLFTSISLISSNANAEVYVYKDENGVIHFSDWPQHKGFRPMREVRELEKLESLSTWSREQIMLLVDRYARQHNMDPRLIEIVIETESSFDPTAVSHKGAMGLMQLMPDTVEWLGVNEPFHPADNIEGGTRFLRKLLDQFDGQLDLALAAYHAGPTRVKRAGGVPNIRSTKNYVKKIMAAYEQR